MSQSHVPYSPYYRQTNNLSVLTANEIPPAPSVQNEFKYSPYHPQLGSLPHPKSPEKVSPVKGGRSSSASSETEWLSHNISSPSQANLSPVTINNLQRTKDSKFPRTASLPSTASPNTLKSYTKPQHPNVYTLSGSTNDACAAKSPKQFSRFSVGGATEQEREGLCMEDLAENGLARSYLADSVVRPINEKTELHETYIVRDDDKETFRLYDGETNDFILSAKLHQRTMWISQYEAVPEVNETGAFCAVLRPDINSEKLFHLFSTRCEHCDEVLNKLRCSECDGYEREHLADISHSVRHIREAGVEARYLSVDIPAVHEGKRVVWCPRAPRGMTMGERNRALSTNFKSDLSSRMEVMSKLPQWNDSCASLVLKFSNKRVKFASSKNILLVDKSEGEDVLLQFGMERKGCYNLDFKYPLSALQAFALALSMFCWKKKKKSA